MHDKEMVPAAKRYRYLQEFFFSFVYFFVFTSHKLAVQNALKLTLVVFSDIYALIFIQTTS